MNNKNIEVLAPAGSFDALKAAVGNGADSVYLGANHFSARKKALNFDSAQLEDAIDYAHLHSVRVYLTLNTLLMDSEIPVALDIAIEAYSAGIDAIIIQDLGFCKVLRDKLPDLEIHASTQATIYDEYAIDACFDLGIKRVILPREFSIDDIKKMTAYANSKGMQTEVFIHGALCVCYSGQCLLSSMIGSRSGNRGECAQPCRLDYDLLLDDKSIGKAKAFLGTKDIYAVDHIKELINAGVSSLKIEGRMRSAEYVGAVTSVYKKLVDQDGEFKSHEEAKEDLRKLLLAFNRGGSFADNYLRGQKGPDLMSDINSGSHGILIGSVIARNSHLGVLDIKFEDESTSGPIEKSDIVSIRDFRTQNEIASAPLGVATTKENIVSVKGFHPDVIENIKIGDVAFLMEDSSLSKEVLSASNKKTKIIGELTQNNTDLKLRLEVLEGIAKGLDFEESINVKELLENEGKSEEDYPQLSEERCKRQISKIKSTSFEFSSLKINSLPNLPVFILNQLRRDAISGLENEIKGNFKKRFFQEDIAPEEINSLNLKEVENLLDDSDEVSEKENLNSKISAYFYEWDGFAESVLCGVDRYELPIWSFYRNISFKGIEDIKTAQPSAQIVISIPPATKPSDFVKMEEILEKLSKMGIYGILSGNPGHYKLANKLNLEYIADTSSNIFNSETAKFFEKNNAETISPSVELSLDEVIRIVKTVKKEDSKLYIELPAFGRLRLMYTEHCPVGYNEKNCRLCSGKESIYSLKDKKDMKFKIVCHPQNCSVDILNANILCAPQEVYNISKLINTYSRLYFGTINTDMRKNIVKVYKDLLNCKNQNELSYLIENVRQLCEGIAKREGSQLTRGHYYRGAY